MKKRQQPSSTDVARRAGVSQSAVSRTFSGQGVSEETRQRVLRAADELGYRPNALLKVITQQSNLIALVMGEITNPFYPEVLEAFLIALEDRGYRVMLKHLDGEKDADAAIEEALAYKVRGIVVTSSYVGAEIARRCSMSDVPVVLFNRLIHGIDVSAISCDNVDAGRLVANLFMDRGFKKPAFISGNLKASSNLDRRKGFFERLAERGGPEPVAIGNEHTYEVGARAAAELISRAEIPDCIFCASDVLAFGALDVLRAASYAVPGQISIVGFDDIPMAAWGAFDLTTLRQPRRRMVGEAVDTLMSRIAGSLIAPARLVPAELVVRGTFKPLGG